MEVILPLDDFRLGWVVSHSFNSNISFIISKCGKQVLAVPWAFLIILLEEAVAHTLHARLPKFQFLLPFDMTG